MVREEEPLISLSPGKQAMWYGDYNAASAVVSGTHSSALS